MGIFDFFRGKKQVSLLDKLKELEEKSNKISNSALQFYNFAYDTLPIKILMDSQKVLTDFYKRGKHAAIVIFSESCLEMGQLPKREDVNLINFEIKTFGPYEFFVINLPRLSKNENNGLPVPTPITIIIVKHNNFLRLFILGLAAIPSVECSIREVNKDRVQSNFGFVTELTTSQFIESLIQIMEKR